MDAYSICCTSASRRNSSKIYQDLKSLRRYSFVDLDQDQLIRRLTTMDGFQRNRNIDPAASPHIAVVGAGLSGLRCADILLKYGFKVTILEARNRVGGRLHQETLHSGHVVDLGPNWIHGTKDNPMLDIARQTNTAVGSWDARSHVFDEFGNLFPLEEGEKYADLMWEIIQAAFRYSNKSSMQIHHDESLHDFFLQKVVEKVPETEPDYEKTRRTILQISELWGAFVGSRIETQSLKFFWLEECIEGENLFCAGTYKKVLDSIAKPVLEGADIHYETKVERISYRMDPDEKVKVQVQGGRSLDFDEVVVTCPLGWLKRNLQAFEPALPIQMTRAIESIGYGCLEKAYITFPKPYWLEAGEHDRKVQGFVQWLAPTYAPDSNPEKWNQEVVELASLGEENSHPTLLFYTYGDQSKYMTSKLAELPTQEKKAEFLFSFYEPYFSRLPNYSETNPDCQPTGFLATDWLHDELAGYGSYSNFQVGLQNGDGDIRMMREGLPDHGLWFAGEHTAPFVGLGTATGAYWSGESVGRRVAEAYGLARKKSSCIDDL